MNLNVIQKIKKIDEKYLYTMVKVHYNNSLSNRHSQRIYSVYNQQNKQIGQCLNLELNSIKFEINESLKKECLETGKLNLHAYALGYLVKFNDKNLEKIHDHFVKLRYNPFSCDGFYCENTNKEVNFAEKLTFNQTGFFIF